MCVCMYIYIYIYTYIYGWGGEVKACRSGELNPYTERAAPATLNCVNPEPT